MRAQSQWFDCEKHVASILYTCPTYSHTYNRPFTIATVVIIYHYYYHYCY